MIWRFKAIINIFSSHIFSIQIEERHAGNNCIEREHKGKPEEEEEEE